VYIAKLLLFGIYQFRMSSEYIDEIVNSVMETLGTNHDKTAYMTYDEKEQLTVRIELIQSPMTRIHLHSLENVLMRELIADINNRITIIMVQLELDDGNFPVTRSDIAQKLLVLRAAAENAQAQTHHITDYARLEIYHILDYVVEYVTEGRRLLGYA
jgi:hypothetical protein